MKDLVVNNCVCGKQLEQLLKAFSFPPNMYLESLHSSYSTNVSLRWAKVIQKNGIHFLIFSLFGIYLMNSGTISLQVRKCLQIGAVQYTLKITYS